MLDHWGKWSVRQPGAVDENFRQILHRARYEGEFRDQSGDSARSSRQMSPTSGRSLGDASRHSEAVSLAASSRSSRRSMLSVSAAELGAI